MLTACNMKIMECVSCGSNELLENDGYLICAYCRSRFEQENDPIVRKETVIDVQSDIQMLLKRCVEDPLNRHRYASLVLDIDPSNSDAIKFLSGGRV